jgi:hypothetical protein
MGFNTEWVFGYLKWKEKWVVLPLPHQHIHGKCKINSYFRFFSKMSELSLISSLFPIFSIEKCAKVTFHKLFMYQTNRSSVNVPMDFYPLGTVKLELQIPYQYH